MTRRVGLGAVVWGLELGLRWAVGWGWGWAEEAVCAHARSGPRGELHRARSAEAGHRRRT
eukprot:scaffold44865_cov60-Phaeocystis_antarctica.AAC.1